jgi:hypothetical protein
MSDSPEPQQPQQQILNNVNARDIQTGDIYQTITINNFPETSLYSHEITFQSYEEWGKDTAIFGTTWISDEHPRFLLSGNSVDGNQELTFGETEDLVLNHLQEAGSVVRISGASGLGKTRFAYELFKGISFRKKFNKIRSISLLYVDYSLQGDDIIKFISRLTKSTSSGLTIVDECPDDIHLKLKTLVQRADSYLRLITIDVETKLSRSLKTLFVKLLPAKEELISSIAKTIRPELSDKDIRIVQNLSVGFPRMAVIAAMNRGDGNLVIEQGYFILKMRLSVSRPYLQHRSA